MKKANLFVSFLCILLGGYVVATASRFPQNNSAVDPGAAYFPTVMGVLLIILSAVLIVFTLMGKGADLNETFVITPGIKRAGVGALLFAAYCFLFKRLGFIIDSILLCVLGMLLLQNKKYVRIAVISIVTSVAIYYIFAQLLGAKLPAGLLKGLF